jgi:hypothetical protein
LCYLQTFSDLAESGVWRESREWSRRGRFTMMNCGDRRELIFLDDEDQQRFITTLGET